MQGVSVKGSAVDPSRGFFARPAPPHPPQSSAHPRFSTNENEPALDVHGQLCRSEPTTAFTLPLVFDPACASTAVFVRRQDPSKDEPLAAAALGQTDPTEPLLFDPACASTSVFSQKQGSFKPAANASQPLPLGSLRSVHLTRQGMPFQTIAENSQESSLGRSPKQSLLEFDPTCASTSVFSQKQGSLRPALIADHPLAFGDSKAAHPQHQQQQYPGVSFHPIAEELQELSPGRHVLEFDPTCASTAVFPWRRRTPPIQDPQPPEFAPPCASTAIFARREPPKTSSASLLQGRLPVATETGPTQPPRVIRVSGLLGGVNATPCGSVWFFRLIFAARFNGISCSPGTAGGGITCIKRGVLFCLVAVIASWVYSRCLVGFHMQGFYSRTEGRKPSAFHAGLVKPERRGHCFYACNVFRVVCTLGITSQSGIDPVTLVIELGTPLYSSQTPLLPP